MKNCSNCEWSISPILEEEIIEEQGYKEEDTNRPKAGDCAIGMKHNKNYVCKKHLYLDGTQEYETYCLYDTKCLGQGYLFVQKLDKKIVKYFKLSIINDMDFPHFFIRGYEKNKCDKSEEPFRKIEFSVSKKDNIQLYELLSKLSSLLNNEKIKTTNELEYGQNYFTVVAGKEEVILTLFKDVYGVKSASDFIDIDLGDNDTCKNYYTINNFYNTLCLIAHNETDDEFIKKLIKK